MTPDPAVRLRFAGTYQSPAGRHFPPHAHSTWEVIYYRAGAIRCIVADHPYETEPGMLLVIPPGVVHSDDARTAYSQLFLRIYAPTDQPWPATCYDDSESTLDRLCRSIEREWTGQGVFRDEMLALLIQQLDLSLRRVAEPAEQMPRDPWEPMVRSAEEILQTRYAVPLTIEQVAHEIGMSPSRLRFHFLRLRGRTPQAALQAIRLRQALDLLRNSTLKLDTVADLCGYHSASHLSRYVRRELGKSPGQLRTGDLSHSSG